MTQPPIEPAPPPPKINAKGVRRVAEQHLANNATPTDQTYPYPIPMPYGFVVAFLDAMEAANVLLNAPPGSQAFAAARVKLVEVVNRFDFTDPPA